MLNGLDGEVDVEVWPIEMVRTRALHVCNRADGGIAEPGKLLEWQEEFPVADQHSEAMPRHIGHFNRKSAVPMRD